MLVRITQKCRMNCSHCMVEAKEDGAHMEPIVFGASLDFIERFEFRVMMLSGGEPTEHPDLLDMIDLSLDRGFKTLVLSNGMFLTDPQLTQALLSKDVLIQVTNDPRFYPQRIQPLKHPKIMYEDSLQLLSPFGRAKGMECSRQSPLCFNLRSATRSYRDFQRGVFHLRSLAKMCTPSINVDGSISAGEAPSCHSIGNVWDSNVALTNAVCEMKCSRCGLGKTLPDKYKQAIGMDT